MGYPHEIIHCSVLVILHMSVLVNLYGRTPAPQSTVEQAQGGGRAGKATARSKSVKIEMKRLRAYIYSIRDEFEHFGIWESRYIFEIPECPKSQTLFFFSSEPFHRYGTRMNASKYIKFGYLSFSQSSCPLVCYMKGACINGPWYVTQ